MFSFSFATLVLISSRYFTIGLADHHLGCQFDGLKYGTCYDYFTLSFDDLLFSEPPNPVYLYQGLSFRNFNLVDLNVTLPPIDAPSRYCPVFTDCIGYGAASKPQNESLDDAGTITTDPGSTFDLGSVDLGCSIRDKNTPPVVNRADRPVFIDLIASCDIKVTGFRADEPDVLGPVIFKFDPPDPVSKPRALTRVEMKSTRFPSTWTRLNKLTIEVVSTSIRDPTTKVVIDDLKVAVLGPCCTF